MSQGKSPYRGWEYARIGDYHRNLDPNWSYTPTYLRKMAFVRQFIEKMPPYKRILDVGCGKGVLVEEFRRKGWDIEGLDLNYESEFVKRGDVRNMPYPEGSFDVVLFLDALEHLSFEDQPKALSELYRVLKPEGYLLLSVPNLAHLNSRLAFVVTGKLDRTDIETNHVGERPLIEYERLLRNAGFQILRRVGVTFTVPWVYRRLICRHPARFRWLHDLLEPFAKTFPSLAMLTIFVCKKGHQAPKYGRVSIWRRTYITLQSRHCHLFSIFTHLNERERGLLFELAKSLPFGATIVEIGSYLGASTCFLAAGARQRNGRVYAVDTWTNIGMSEGPRDTYQEFLHNIKPLRQWIVPLRGLSTEIAKQFNGKIDLLFVDGDHSYEAVRADLEAWLPKVKDGGIVVFHDYNWAEGVKRAVREVVVPIQIEGGRRIDSIYWTRVSPKQKRCRESALKASIIIPTYGRSKYLNQGLSSVQLQEFNREEYEIIVVDNSPLGEVRAVVEEANRNGPHPVRYVHEPHVGLHNARHAGARVARGEILVYIDDDVVVHPRWLAAIVKPFDRPQVGCVGGKVIAKWETEPPDWWSQYHPGYLSLLDLGNEQVELKWPQGVHGCNMAVRRSVLYEVGGFNPDAIGDRRHIWLRGDGETGLQKKIYNAGYKVIYEPQAWVYHQIPASRLTPRYFSWRAFIQGISDSYSRARDISASRILLLRLLWHGLRCLIKAALCYVAVIRYPDKRMRLRSDTWYWYGRGMHQIRVALSPRLRKHVLQDTYLR